MPKHQINEYHCESCNKKIVTIDIHEGATPFMTLCPACNAPSHSVFYKCDQHQVPNFYWYKPADLLGFSAAVIQYIENGGLIRAATAQPFKTRSPQVSPNRASCIVTSAAIVLGVPVEELINQIGHDGTDLAFPDLPIPRCYQSFSINEIVFALYERGYSCTPFSQIGACVEQISGRTHNVHLPNGIMYRLLAQHDGILTGYMHDRPHALAWFAGDCINPSTGARTDLNSFALQTFYAIEPKSNQS